jgi:hypothetical protein
MRKLVANNIIAKNGNKYTVQTRKTYVKVVNDFPGSLLQKQLSTWEEWN